MIKMPLARAKAADASLPTLVEEGKVCLRIRRTHASGGSNSTAEGGPLFCCLFSLSAVLVVVVVAVAASVAATVTAGAGSAGLIGLMVVNVSVAVVVVCCCVLSLRVLVCGGHGAWQLLPPRIWNKHPEVLKRGAKRGSKSKLPPNNLGLYSVLLSVADCSRNNLSPSRSDLTF
jgi:hypothetical protein